MTDENIEEKENPAEKINSVRKQEEKSDATIDSAVANRLQQEAIEGAKKQAENNQLQVSDPTRPISLGELRKLIGEVNGSFDKVAKLIQSSAEQININLNHIHTFHARLSKIEQQLGINYMDTLPEQKINKPEKE